MDLFGSTAVGLVFPLVFTIGVGALNTVALYRIITKAGYSGA